MARILGALLLMAVGLAGAGCAERDRSSESATPGSSDSATGEVSSQTATPVPEQWDGELSGGLTGTVTGTLVPQCRAVDDSVSVTLGGSINGVPVSINVVTAGPGSFNLAHPYDEGPTVDVATGGESAAEWFVHAGDTTGEGQLTLERDGSGSMSATLNPISAGSDQSVVVAAEWVCPED